MYDFMLALENPVKNSKGNLLVVASFVLYEMYCTLLFLYTVYLDGSELQIRLEKATREMMWTTLGVLLPGNAEVTPRCSDSIGENQSYTLDV